MDRIINTKTEQQSIYEIYRACRLCGAGAGYKMPIIQNVVDLDTSGIELTQKIRDCVQIEVNKVRLKLLNTFLTSFGTSTVRNFVKMNRWYESRLCLMLSNNNKFFTVACKCTLNVMVSLLLQNVRSISFLPLVLVLLVENILCRSNNLIESNQNLFSCSKLE